MAKMRSINTKFWDDNWIVSLDTERKLLFLYLLTNGLTNISGCYEISLKRIAFDTGIEQDKIIEILDEFTQAKKIFYRDGWILIQNFIKNQSLNPKIVKGIEETVKHCPIWIKDSLPIAYQSLSHLNSNSNSNSDTNVSGDAPSDSSLNVPVKNPVGQRIWTDGIELLTQNGLAENSARSLMGKLAKDYSNELLAECIAVTQAKNPVDAKEFLIATLNARKSGKNSFYQKPSENLPSAAELQKQRDKYSPASVRGAKIL